MFRVWGGVAPVFSGLLLASRGLDIPTRKAWDDTGDPFFVVLVIAVVVAALYGLFRVVDEPIRSRQARRAQEDLETERGLQLLCRRAFVPVNRALPEVHIAHIGVHVWRVATDGSRLERVYKFTMEHERTETPIVWTPGRGAIGRAWAARQIQVVTDFDNLYRDAQTMTDEAFDGLPEDQRLGLRREEVLEAGDRYRAIVAVPLFGVGNGGRAPVLGVFSVDFMESVPLAALTKLTNDIALQDILGACQNLLRRTTTGWKVDT